jgi:hypothetical protein
MDWELEIALHLPHNQLLLGWKYLMPTEEFNYSTLELHLLFISFKIDF